MTGLRPPDAAPNNVTLLLRAWSDGDTAVEQQLLKAVQDELRRQAARALRNEAPGHTLQPTALVNEAYLRLIDQRHVEWRNRAHFFGISARLMRRILVDHARGRLSAKRGGNAQRISIGDVDPVDPASEAAQDIDLLALHEALQRLAKLDPALERLVEMRYFTGLTVDETAEALGISRATVGRDWSFARAWLRRELEAA